MNLNIPSKFSLNRLFYNKKFTVAFSIIITFIFWLIIMIDQNPVREQTFTDITATVSIENTAASDQYGLGIVSDISSQKFTVVLSGPNYIVSSLKPEDFLLSASVADVTKPGTYTLNLVGSRNSSKSGYSFISIVPATIDVVIDHIDTKEFDVNPRLIGVSASSGLVAESPIISDAAFATLTVKGPDSVISKIARVDAYAEINKTLSESQTFDTGIVLCDDNENILYHYTTDGKIYDGKDNLIENNYLSLDFTTVRVTAPISMKKTVKVEAAFSNLPEAMKASDVTYTVDHASVSVIGAPEIVEKIDKVTLSAIDFTGVSLKSNRFEVSLKLPDGVRLMDSIEAFTVTINTKGYKEKVLNVSNVRVTNLGTGLTVKNTGRISNVRICGPAAMVNAVQADDLFALVDLSDKTTGAHTIPAKICSDRYGLIWQVGNYTTTVTLK